MKITYMDGQCSRVYLMGFEWIYPEEFQLEKVLPDNPIGHALEVDLEYPTNLHNDHNDIDC